MHVCLWAECKADAISKGFEYIVVILKGFVEKLTEQIIEFFPPLHMLQSL